MCATPSRAHEVSRVSITTHTTTTTAQDIAPPPPTRATLPPNGFSTHSLSHSERARTYRSPSMAERPVPMRILSSSSTSICAAKPVRHSVD